MSAIKISHVSKRYGSKTALRDVSLTVGNGQIYGFLGPNGAGKTTTIRCIMDFIRPSAGTVTIFGLDSRRDSAPVRQQIGFLSADHQLYDKWNATQHIAFISSVRGGPNSSGKLLKRLDLDPAVAVRHMSTGNKQKLGLVLSLMNNPKLLILDEPTNGLDPLLQHEIYHILKEYASQGGTVFLSSHNLAEVERICTNVGIIRQGQIIASKSLHDIGAINIRIVTISFPGSSMPPPLELPGATIVTSSPGNLVLKVRGDINPLIARLAAHRLRDVEITHAPLEEIFMEYYRGQS